MDDNDELNELLEKAVDTVNWASPSSRGYDEPPCAPVRGNSEEEKYSTNPVQWSTSNGKIFIPTGKTVDILIPGYYEIGVADGIGLYFEKIPVKIEGILEFPEAVTQKVVREIQLFWEREDVFRDFKLTYKRGVILWGNPGTGKSATLQLISRDVIKRGGIVIKFSNPGTFALGLRKLKEIQPEVPVVVLMEDIDSIIKHHSETDVINLLDGVDEMDKIVFLATTNYPSDLGDRIMNRPSRFDKRFKVGFPNPESRKIYFEYLVGDRDLPVVDVEQWVKDTENFSIAHLKELFVAVVILGDSYEEALTTLKSMKSRSKLNETDDFGMGFRK